MDRLFLVGHVFQFFFPKNVDHVHELHLRDAVDRRASSSALGAFQRSLVFPFQGLLDAEIVLNKVVKIVFVEQAVLLLGSRGVVVRIVRE